MRPSLTSCAAVFTTSFPFIRRLGQAEPFMSHCQKWSEMFAQLSSSSTLSDDESSSPCSSLNPISRLTMRTSSLLLQGSAVALLLLASAYLTTSSPAQGASVSLDQPNPIALQYPSLVSGTLNGTTLIVPIPLAAARAAIPKEYGILEHVYRQILPSFPEGMYPLVATAVHDHDIQFPLYNLSIPDFSVSFTLPSHV